ncbi:transglycosylase SLT domain-containing protein [Vannielia sp.]|uniref:transglycosylase SLT domain-containing protein n=1 Tax=Vannielia sp. TaxID=2813045 RepID=UPI002633BF73|nr:transglycosylase SLT domain-containing protein [Vannielia sp.]MDF1871048.1 transglycosylase SLT domain-containing protein [Vannielia sp.]
MSRKIGIVLVLGLLAACGGGSDKKSPRNLEDACLLLQERPTYYRAFKKTEKNWGVPVHVQMATIHQESKFDPDARTPFKWAVGVIPMGRQSSAYGYSQALDATWEEYKKETGNRRAKRDDIKDATDFMGWYMNKTRERNGVSLTDARSQYLAYHEGHTGFRNASYNSKPWLVRVAGEVGLRSEIYRVQLASCRKN